ncbi:unnamed protein product [Porites lobata]|uniref:G-protein coupled receptors family 1 profile domain-containing protein n=1 Tax=Porites lobata TaxID=104759 RepID=A0ABN8QRL3_9CNID|nr:unnamed protein product [Porites lobata]
MFNKKIPIIVISAFIGLALLITFASYASIWIKFKKRVFKPRTSATEMNKNLVKTLFIVTVLSLISWLPFKIIFILFHLLSNVQISNSIIVITRLVQYANSLLNPIVYNLRMPDFRREMKKILCGCVVKDIPKSNIRLVSMKRNGTSAIWRKSAKFDESVDHMLSGCPELAKTEYIQKHDNATLHIHWKVCQIYKITTADKLCEDKPETVVKTKRQRFCGICQFTLSEK